MEGLDFSIVIPAYNEQDNIPGLVDEILRIYGETGYEIILVDDNSSDDTPAICDKLAAEHTNIRTIHRKEGNNGMGHALMEGSQASVGAHVFWVMGDRSDELERIAEMNELLESGHDMVMASRYMKGGSRGDLSADKAMYGSVYTRLANLVFGIPVHDITNAYRGFKRELLDIGVESGTFSISPEFAIKAHLRGHKLGEVPTTYINRRAGQPKFNLARMGVEYASLFMLRLRYPR